MRRALTAVAVALACVAAWVLLVPEPPAEAVGPGDVIGEYVLKLRGQGFDRNATSGRISEDRVRGRALLTILRTSDVGDPRDVTVRIALDSSLKGSVLDRATPTPDLEGRGVLVGDSLTVVGVGQSNFVNAVMLRFNKKGKKVEGWWLVSFPGADAVEGFVGGAGLAFKGKRLRASKPVPAASLVR